MSGLSASPSFSVAWRWVLSGLALAGLLWGLVRLADWAVLQAVFEPDLAACKALARQGACWGVIDEKFRPLLLGRYPFEQQWRPLVALLLGLGALPLALLLARWHRVAGWGPAISRPALPAWVIGTGAMLALVLLRGGVAGLPVVPLERWGGLPLTLVLAVLSLGLSLPLGIALALGRRSQRTWLRWFSTAWIELVRGVPLVTLLFMGAFMLPALFPADMQPSLFVRVSAALTLFSAAYLAEIVRSGLQTVPREQYEAAEVLGLGAWGTYRRVVLPQALRAVLPALTGHTIGLLKDTSLVMVVGMHELTGSLGLALGGDADWRPFYLEGYLFIASLYAAMCLGLGWLGRRLEARWQSAVR